MAFVQPDNAPSPAYDAALDRLFHDAVAGITGLDPSLVRPRWQPEPPNQPDFSITWAAFGLVDTDDDRLAYVVHDPTGEAGAGADRVSSDQTLTVLYSFYGPAAAQTLNNFRLGMQVSQNREQLGAAGIKLVEFQSVVQLPALLKDRWVKRLDVRAVYRRRLERVYSVPTILSADVDIGNEQYHTPVTITPTSIIKP